MKISNTNSVKENKLKILINGPSGSGKTKAVEALKAAQYKPLVISFESGLLSIANSNIDFIDGSRDDNGNLIPKELRINRLTEIYKFIMSDEAKNKYDSIYIDSLTEICQCLHDALKREFPERKDSLVMYGELSTKMRDLIKAFRDVPHYHVVFTCLSKVEKDPDGRRYIGFDLIGSIADKLPQFFDEVFFLRVLPDSSREFVCKATDSVVCKDRSGKLNQTETYNLGLIFNKILQKETTKNV